MAAQWPRVKARLIELLPTLAGWDTVTVFPGRANTNSIPVDATTGRARWVTVGHTSADETGGYASELSGDGFLYIERGAVMAELNIQCGSSEQAPAIEAEMYALLDALDGAVRTDRTLGVLSQEGVATFAVTLSPTLNNAGAAVLARFSCNYLTVT